MLNVKRYHFIDTLYFTIAIASVLLLMFLYFITSQGAAKLKFPCLKKEQTRLLSL